MTAEGSASAGRPPTIAVVVPARNEVSSIGSCLDSILAGSLLPDEILVVDGESTDGTQDVVSARIPGPVPIRLIDNERRTIPSGLNLGWRATDCDLIVRVDAHAAISPNYLCIVRDRLLGGDWQGVGGRKVPHSRTPTGRAVAAAMGTRWGVGNSRYHYATVPEEAEHVPFGAYPRAVIEALGGWDEALLVNQDFEFDYRLRQSGGRLLFDPALESRWACSRTIRDLSHQYHRYGRGKALVARRHPGSLRVRHLIPPALVLVLAIDGFRSQFLRRRPPLAALGYGTLLTWTYWSGAGRALDSDARRRLPLVLGIMHTAWGAGFLRGVIDCVRAGRTADPYRSRHLEL